MNHAAPTYSAYDRHLAELDQAAAIWKREVAKEADPELRRLQRLMVKHITANAATLRELLAYCRERHGRQPKPIVIDERDRN